MIRSTLKRGLEVISTASGIASVARFLRRTKSVVLAYHNIVPSESAAGGDQSLHLIRSRFAEHLDLLTRIADVVSLESILECPAIATARPRVAITFDDGYRGAVTLGVKELAVRGLPATIFVSPGFVGARSFWWDSLQGDDGEPITSHFRGLALGQLRGDDALVRGRAVGFGLNEVIPHPYAVTATESELRRATEVPGITLGSHSWNHLNLSQLDLTDLRYELVESLRWLRDRFDSVIPWLAYPYGLSSETVEKTVAEAGYSAALRVAGGWLPEGRENRYALPRYNVASGLSHSGLALLLSGISWRETA